METDEVKRLARKAMLMGIGLGVITKEKAESLAKELLEKGRANEDDVRQFADDIMAEAEKKRKEVMAFVDKKSKEAAAKADVLLKKAKSEYGRKLKFAEAKLRAKLKPKAKKKAAKKKKKR